MCVCVFLGPVQMAASWPGTPCPPRAPRWRPCYGGRASTRGTAPRTTRRACWRSRCAFGCTFCFPNWATWSKGVTCLSQRKKIKALGCWTHVRCGRLCADILKRGFFTHVMAQRIYTIDMHHVTFFFLSLSSLTTSQFCSLSHTAVWTVGKTCEAMRPALSDMFYYMCQRVLEADAAEDAFNDDDDYEVDTPKRRHRGKGRVSGAMTSSFSCQSLRARHVHFSSTQWTKIVSQKNCKSLSLLSLGKEARCFSRVMCIWQRPQTPRVSHSYIPTPAIFVIDLSCDFFFLAYFLKKNTNQIVYSYRYIAILTPKIWYWSYWIWKMCLYSHGKLCRQVKNSRSGLPVAHFGTVGLSST